LEITNPLLESPYIFCVLLLSKIQLEKHLLHHFIKSFNKQNKKHTKRREQFSNEKALGRFLVSQIEEYNKRLAVHCHTVFEPACAELARRNVSIN